MSLFNNLNIITVLIAGIFIIPIGFGIAWPPVGERMRSSFIMFFGNVLFFASVLLALYLTRVLLTDGKSTVMQALYGIVPMLESYVAAKSVWVYAVFFVVILIMSDILLYLVTIPFYRFVLDPLSRKFTAAVESMRIVPRRIIGGIWQVPKSVWLVLVFSILINFYTGIFSKSWITEYADTSVPYQYIQANVLQPVLNDSVVKGFQTLLNSSFQELSKTDRNSHLTRYINGVTLDEAVKSNADIRAKAQQIIGSEINDRQKAYLLYSWICKNIDYDSKKAETISSNPFGVSSGAIEAFNKRKGICFDYACLYVAMCREAGLKVRFMTGLGYSGKAWGDHAWNQVYSSANSKWLNVDTTFGSSGINYFDRPNFDLDHVDGIVQEEWS